MTFYYYLHSTPETTESKAIEAPRRSWKVFGGKREIGSGQQGTSLLRYITLDDSVKEQNRNTEKK